MRLFLIVKKMAGYRFVKYCRLCKKRFLLNQGEKNQNYCDECIKKFKKEE